MSSVSNALPKTSRLDDLRFSTDALHTLHAHVTRIQVPNQSDVLVYESAATPDAFKTLVISIGPLVVSVLCS